MSIAHQMRVQRQIATQERKSLWVGTTVLGCSALAVIGAVAFVLVNRGLAKDEDGLADANSKPFSATAAMKPASRRADRVHAATTDAFLDECKRRTAVAGLAIGLMGGANADTPHGRDAQRQMLNGSMCDQAFDAMRQMQDVQRKVKRGRDDD